MDLEKISGALRNRFGSTMGRIVENLFKKADKKETGSKEGSRAKKPRAMELPMEKGTKHVFRKAKILPVRVGKFDLLLSDRGLERGTITLISGGTGTGKTTFCMQSLYYGALKGEKGVYISFEEEPEMIMEHMMKNYGWDFYKLEKKGLVALIKIDPVKAARMVEGTLAKETGKLVIEIPKITLPIKPDRITTDSLSALSIAFKNEENYRKYVRELFDMLSEFNSVNYVISETEQNPRVFSRTGVEEFLADGVVVLYNLRIGGKRQSALEILKIRTGKHVKKMVPYKMGKGGIEVLYEEKMELK